MITSRFVAGVVSVAAAATLVVASCGDYNDAHGKGDAPVGRTADAAADIINMPDGYGNIATKCVPYQPGKRIYIMTHGKTDVPPVIIDDVSCK